MIEEDNMKPMLPSEKYFGNLELVYAFYGAMPTGVTVSETGRIFICFPKWGDDVKFTVGSTWGEHKYTNRTFRRTHCLYLLLPLIAVECDEVCGSLYNI